MTRRFIIRPRAERDIQSAYDWYESQEDVIEFSQNLQMVDLSVTAEEIARRIAKNIFHIFNWTDVADAVIQKWQDKIVSSMRG